MLKRSSGIILPMYSLASKYGIGTIGKKAYEFVDFLCEAGQTYWQLLPLGPTQAGDSPYSSPSTFAGNPFFVDLDLLIEDGLLERKEVEKINWGDNEEKVDYEAMNKCRLPLLKKAYEKNKTAGKYDVEAFNNSNMPWVENYAMFSALKKHFDMTPWTEWPEDIRMRKPDAMGKYRAELGDEIDFYIFVQCVFFSQWKKLKEYAEEKNIKFIGDIPIYVALDSADVWSEPWFFQLDEKNAPVDVSGVPPDAFTDKGQKWNNPLYNYEAMRNDGFGWWIRRIEGAQKLYDVVRIDHFRGFEKYWSIPYKDEDARNGKWCEGPGMSLVGVLTSWFYDLEFIAEDLGEYSLGLVQLLKASGLPGMRVLQFAFDAKDNSTYLPHNCPYNSCCYTGTHDNDTISGWSESLSKKDRDFAAEYMHKTDDESWEHAMIRTGMATASNLFMMQMQDILECDGICRTNIPGVAEGNWRWRMKHGKVSSSLAKKLLRITRTYRRTAI